MRFRARFRVEAIVWKMGEIIISRVRISDQWDVREDARSMRGEVRDEFILGVSLF